MAYDKTLADRVRDLMRSYPGYSERKMFGGICFMLHGNMACGINGHDLMVRCGPDVYDELLSNPEAGPMDFTGRPMKGFVTVRSETLIDDQKLAEWVAWGTDYAASLPKKANKK